MSAVPTSNSLRKHLARRSSDWRWQGRDAASAHRRSPEKPGARIPGSGYDVGESLPAQAASAGLVIHLSLDTLHVSIRQGLHERNDGILLILAEAEIAELARVHVCDDLRRRPARDLLAGIISRAARQDVACVVEMHDVLEAGEVPIVHVGFDKGRVWPLVDVAQCRNPYLAGELRRICLPGRVRVGLAAQLMRAI